MRKIYFILLITILAVCCSKDDIDGGGSSAKEYSGIEGEDYPAPYELWYTSIDGNVINFQLADTCKSNKILANIYRNGKGVLTFQNDLVTIPHILFKNWKDDKERDKVTSVKFPKITKHIDGFFDCTNLTKVIIPSGVLHIEGLDNTKISEIYLPEGLLILDGLYGCTNIKEIRIPESLKTIKALAFANSGIQSIDMKNVCECGSRAFRGCKNLSEAICSDNLQELPDSIFARCEKLSSVKLGQNLQKIRYGAFTGCSSLESIDLPSSLTYLDCSAFNECKLSSLSIPANVNEIGTRASYGGYVYIYNRLGKGCPLTSISVAPGNKTFDSRNDCNAIIHTATNSLISGCASTVIPETVTTIGNNAFSYCLDLESIYIPANISYIPENPFWGCSLKSIIVSPNNSVYDSRSNCNAIIKTKDNSLLIGCGGTVIPDNVETIQTNAFDRCQSLTSISLNNVKTISSYAFFYCENLQNIEMSNSLENIASSAFYGCKSLKQIHLFDNIKTIGRYAFGNCSSLTDVYAYWDFKNNPPKIEDSLFYSNYPYTLHLKKGQLQYFNKYSYKKYFNGYTSIVEDL